MQISDKPDTRNDAAWMASIYVSSILLSKDFDEYFEDISLNAFDELFDGISIIIGERYAGCSAGEAGGKILIKIENISKNFVKGYFGPKSMKIRNTSTNLVLGGRGDRLAHFQPKSGPRGGDCRTRI